MKLRCLLAVMCLFLSDISDSYSYSLSEKHWQERMTVGVVELNGVLRIKEKVWVWQPNSQFIGEITHKRPKYDLNTDRKNLKSLSKEYYILEGYTSRLISTRPGIQPSVSLLHVNVDEPKIDIRGECSEKYICYGELNFAVKHILAYQDKAMAQDGWGVIGSNFPDPGTLSPRVGQLLRKTTGYDYKDSYLEKAISTNAFTTVYDQKSQELGHGQDVAGAWVTSIQILNITFPETEYPVKKWQGRLIPQIVYF